MSAEPDAAIILIMGAYPAIGRAASSSFEIVSIRIHRAAQTPKASGTYECFPEAE